MKKLVGICILLLCIGLFVSNSIGVDIKQGSKSSSDGYTWYVGGNGPGNFTAIQDAIDNASNGDTVFVYKGVYDGGLYIDKTISLQGEQREETIIDGVVGIHHHGISIYGDGVHVSGFTIQNVGNFWPEAALFINSYDTEISNNIISDNKFGIDMFETYHTHIHHNLIINQNRYDGMYIRFSSENTISHNIIDNNNGFGIIMIDSSNNTISKNSISNNGWGGVTNIDEHEMHNLIYHNNFYHNEPDNAWDAGGNNWNYTQEFGGNFWDDYTGVDDNNDGIGDTPYQIKGGGNKDHYPFISPIVSEMATVEIKSVSSTPFGITVELQNTGWSAAVELKWSMSLDGGLILGDKETTGSLDYLFYKESCLLSTNKFIGFGPSELTIRVKAGNGEQIDLKKEVFLFFFFSFIK